MFKKRIKAVNRRRALFWLECRLEDKKLNLIQKKRHHRHGRD